MTFTSLTRELRFFKFAGIISVLALVSACGSSSSSSPNTPEVPEDTRPTITEIASGDDRFDSLQLALETTGLDEALNDRAATFTVFAPTDEAFDKLGDTLNELLNDPDGLAAILKYHVVNGAALSSQTAIGLAGTTLGMLSGDKVAVTLQDGKLFINNAEVIVTDVAASNGTIHAIDTVITQPVQTTFDGTIAEAAVKTKELSTLVTALQTANLVEALGAADKKFTVFAPTDDAFAKIPQADRDALLADIDALTDVLLYHVIDGAEVDSITAISLTGKEATMMNGENVAVKYMDGKLYVNGSQVITTDIVTDNGIVHLIDTVLTPPVGAITRVAGMDENFSTLVTALELAGLDSVLADKNAMFTVFAPTNEAFAKIPQEDLDALLADKEALTNVLLYHVISGAKIDSTAAIQADGTTIEMANMINVNVTLSGDELFINESKVIATDVQADNGVIHAVDTVILPPGNIVDAAVKADIFASLAAALADAGVETNGETTKTVFDATELTDVLSDANEKFTVFVPTADAFTALGEQTLLSLAQNPAQLKDILLYHVVAGAKIDSTAAVAAAGSDLTMADGNMAAVALDGDSLTVGGATVVTTNVQASNGIIHFIDKVIMPDMSM